MIPELISKAGPYRRALVVIIQISLVALSNYLAFWLRFDGHIPDDYYVLWAQVLPCLILLRALTFFPFRLYEGLWRYSSIHDLRNIVGASITSSVLVAIAQVVLGYGIYPRSIYILDSLLLVSMLGGIRLTRRLYREIQRVEGKRRILVYGAGDAGEMIVRDMKTNPAYDMEPIAFIDDDRHKVGQRIHGIPVLGTRNDLPRILIETRAAEVLIAMPGAEALTLRAVVKVLESVNVPIKTLPNLKDLLDRRVGVSDIRNLSLEDLLPRAPVGLDPEPVRRMVIDKVVLITGAGGSIGSELARQVVCMQPSRLVLFERYENTLHEIFNELRATHPLVDVQSVVGDITDSRRVEQVLRTHRPNMVFHAAAHKHVPLMEDNPCEAIKNNVRGTRVLVEAVEKFGVARFILISTDKAVNPVSVMGATKRIAELFVQTRKAHLTDFLTVRFGNVLGSNGSVVPHFLKQIKNGGPVTLTHPEMKRYFMLIPEAVQLVLQVTAAGHSGSTYVLDMGSEFGVLDLARNLIRLCGHIPDVDIPISYIGLRPGEKLSEDLIGQDETVEPSEVARISRVQPRVLPSREFVDLRIAELEKHAAFEDVESVLSGIIELVPTYKPGSTHQIERAYLKAATR